MAAAPSEVEQVYTFIWEYVKDIEALPSMQMIVDATGLSRYVISRSLVLLRAQGRITPRIFLPTAYAQWWCEHVGATWSYRAMQESRMNTHQLQDILDAERVYKYIVAFMDDNGEPPRPIDIAGWYDWSISHVDRVLALLRGAGRICERSTLPTVHTDPLPPAA